MSHDPQVLTAGRVSQSASDHISVQVVQRIIQVYLLTFSGLIDTEGLYSMFFQMTITCKDGSVAHGGEYLDSPWMLDTSLHSTGIQDMSWFIRFQQWLFPQV